MYNSSEPINSALFFQKQSLHVLLESASLIEFIQLWPGVATRRKVFAPFLFIYYNLMAYLQKIIVMKEGKKSHKDNL